MSPSAAGPQQSDAQLAEGLPTVQTQIEIRRQVEFLFEHLQGPLPPPEVLARYEQAMPGLQERIVKMAESSVEIARSQSEHRQSLERMVVGNGILMERLGLACAFTIGLAGLGGGFWLAYHDKQVAGITAFLTTLGALVATFIQGRRQQARELAAKRQGEQQAQQKIARQAR